MTAHHSGRWLLSPVFDVNPVPDRNLHLETAICEGGSFERSVRMALEAYDFFEIPEGQARAYEPAFVCEQTEIPLGL